MSLFLRLQCSYPVGDCVAVNLWCLDHPGHPGVYNGGTGRAQTFNELARAVIAWEGRGEIQYIPFPEHLQGAYQSFTEADVTALQKTGYRAPWLSVAEGVYRYLDAMANIPEHRHP
jgi:ADP-L-glycero-D-manno-heptose 6-epimerase